jgi:hypothetical protein
MSFLLQEATNLPDIIADRMGVGGIRLCDSAQPNLKRKKEHEYERIFYVEYDVLYDRRKEYVPHKDSPAEGAAQIRPLEVYNSDDTTFQLQRLCLRLVWSISECQVSVSEHHHPDVQRATRTYSMHLLLTEREAVSYEHCSYSKLFSYTKHNKSCHEVAPCWNGTF